MVEAALLIALVILNVVQFVQLRAIARDVAALKPETPGPAVSVGLKAGPITEQEPSRATHR